MFCLRSDEPVVCTHIECQPITSAASMESINQWLTRQADHGEYPQAT